MIVYQTILLEIKLSNLLGFCKHVQTFFSETNCAHSKYKMKYFFILLNKGLKHFRNIWAF